MQPSFEKDSPRVIGDSLPIATKSYAHLESRSRTRPEIRKHHYEFLRVYCEFKLCDDFLHECCELNHVMLVTEGWVSLFKIICIPHHAVIRDASIARLRVVLDASDKIRDDTSLGDHLLIGAKLQRVLPFTTIRWRPWRSVHTANISGMFLQILVDPAISMDAASTEKVAAETRQLIVLYLDCVDKQKNTLQKRIAFEVQRVNSVEHYYRSRFIKPPWRAIVRYKLCQLLRWQLVQTMQEQIWRSWSKDYLHCKIVVKAIIECTG